MKLLENQIDKAALSRVGEEAISLLEKRDFPSLASRFGYALSFERDPATAIEKDFQTCVAACQGLSDQQRAVTASVVVKYYRPNDSLRPEMNAMSPSNKSAQPNPCPPRTLFRK